jgi:hypothetical protein
MIRHLPLVGSLPSQTTNLFPMEGSSRKTRRLSRSDRVSEQWFFNKLIAVLILQTGSLIMQIYYICSVIVVIWTVSINFLSINLESLSAWMDYQMFSLFSFTLVLIQSADDLLGFRIFKATCEAYFHNA